jgi:hypothetical protein
MILFTRDDGEGQEKKREGVKREREGGIPFVNSCSSGSSGSACSFLSSAL